MKNNNNDNDAVYDVRDTYNANFGVDANGQLKGIDTETDTGLGIYKVSLRSDNSVVLTKLWSEPNKADVSENSDLLYKQDNAAKQTGKSVRLVPGSLYRHLSGRYLRRDSHHVSDRQDRLLLCGRRLHRH